MTPGSFLLELAQVPTVHEAERLGSASAQTILAFIVLVLLAAGGWLALENRRLVKERLDSIEAANREKFAVAEALYKEALKREQDLAKALGAIEALPEVITAFHGAVRDELARHHEAIQRIVGAGPDSGANATRRTR